MRPGSRVVEEKSYDNAPAHDAAPTDAGRQRPTDGRSLPVFGRVRGWLQRLLGAAAVNGGSLLELAAFLA